MIKFHLVLFGPNCNGSIVADCGSPFRKKSKRFRNRWRDCESTLMTFANSAVPFRILAHFVEDLSFSNGMIFQSYFFQIDKWSLWLGLTGPKQLIKDQLKKLWSQRLSSCTWLGRMIKLPSSPESSRPWPLNVNTSECNKRTNSIFDFIDSKNIENFLIITPILDDAYVSKLATKSKINSKFLIVKHVSEMDQAPEQKPNHFIAAFAQTFEWN